MTQRICISLIVALVFSILGCGPKVMVPPEVDLKEYENVGLIEFSSEAEGELNSFVTQKFMEEISRSQRGVRIIELGTVDSVLQEVRRDQLDPKAIQAIGQKYNLRSIIIGELDVSKVKPKVSLSAIIQHVSVRAEVDASLSVRLVETEQGATVWTDSAQEKREVASVSIFSGGPFIFDAKDPEEAYGELAESLVEKVTRDLRETYRRM